MVVCAECWEVFAFPVQERPPKQSSHFNVLVNDLNSMRALPSVASLAFNEVHSFIHMLVSYTH